MDPNANLQRQRAILAELREMHEAVEVAEERGHGTDQEQERQLVALLELSELAEDLDEWLSRGGFAPEAWRRGPDVDARQVDEHTTGVTIGGVDVYVRNALGQVIVSLGIDELPEGKTALVESFDGISWEHELP